MTGMPFNEAIRSAVDDGDYIQSSTGTIWKYENGKWWTKLGGSADAYRQEPCGPTTGTFTVYRELDNPSGRIETGPEPTHLKTKTHRPEDVKITIDAKRDNGGKAQLSYLLQFAPALEGVARNCAFGTDKYERYGNQKGMPYTEILDSCFRHVIAWYGGEEKVPDALAAGFDVHHLDAAIWNLLQLRTQISTEKGEHDDRPPNVRDMQETKEP